MIKEWLKRLWKGWQEAAEAWHQAKLDAGCEYCTRTPICQECFRCFDRDCSAGCIYCNPVPIEVDVCPCCRRSI